MGFDLKPRRPEAGRFHMGAFSWSWMLGSGVGLIIGYQEAEGGKNIFCGRPVGRDRIPTSPNYNDGFPVTADEARAMAHAARGLVACEEFRHKRWEALTPEQQKQEEAVPCGTFDKGGNYRSFQRGLVPVRRDFLEKASAFADWAERSGGFRIY